MTKPSTSDEDFTVVSKAASVEDALSDIKAGSHGNGPFTIVTVNRDKNEFLTHISESLPQRFYLAHAHNYTANMANLLLCQAMRLEINRAWQMISRAEKD